MNQPSRPDPVNEVETAPKTGAFFKYAVFGDSKILPGRPSWQGNMVLSEIVDRINREDPAFVIYLGDGPDRGGPISNMRAYREAMEKLKPPWHPAPGNHEILNGAGPDGKQGDGVRLGQPESRRIFY